MTTLHSNSVFHCLHMTSLQTDSWAALQLEELSWCSLSCTNSFWVLSLWHYIQWFSSESQFLLESAYLVIPSLKEGSKTGLFFCWGKKKILLAIRAIPQEAGFLASHYNSPDESERLMWRGKRMDSALWKSSCPKDFCWAIKVICLV